MKIIHGSTGSVAATVSHKWRAEYSSQGFDSVSFMQTDSADHFTNAEAGATVTYNTAWEWHLYHKDGIVLHINLVKNYDALVIAPLSANTLAKIANGICDNLLTCVARAWDFNKPFIVAPAMNTNMWNHPITKEHVDKITSWGVRVVPPVEKTLFCGDTGIGAMENIGDIISELKLIK